MVHPETTGMAFSLAAILYLVKYLDTPLRTYLYLSYSFLILASLTKQAFSFISVPILLIFLLSYLYRNKIPFCKILCLKSFWKTVILFITLGLIILLLIHPYLLSEFSTFYAGQQYLSKTHQADLTFLQSFERWSRVFSSNPLVLINVLLVLTPYLFMVFKRTRLIYSLFTASVVFCNLFLVLVMYGARTPNVISYLYPILPLLILNVVAVTLFIWTKLSESLKIIRIIKFAYIVIFGCTFSVMMVFNSLETASGSATGVRKE